MYRQIYQNSSSIKPTQQVYLPFEPIKVKITNIERCSSNMLNPYLYAVIKLFLFINQDEAKFNLQIEFTP